MPGIRSGARLRISAPDELSTEESFGSLRALAEAKPTPVVILTSGVPLERPDFFEILDFAKSLELHVDVAPSVTPKLTREAVEKLHAHGVGAMSLSLDGSDAEKHDSLRGIPGVFERTLEAADILADCHIPLRVNTLVPANTLSDLPAIHGVAARMKAQRWSLFFWVTTGRGSLLPQLEPEQAEELPMAGSMSSELPSLGGLETGSWYLIKTFFARRGEAAHAGLTGVPRASPLAPRPLPLAPTEYPATAPINARRGNQPR